MNIFAVVLPMITLVVLITRSFNAAFTSCVMKPTISTRESLAASIYLPEPASTYKPMSLRLTSFSITAKTRRGDQPIVKNEYDTRD
jgi:hypothetical protein